MSLKTCVKVVAQLLLVTLCTAAPYEASPSSTAAPPAPEKLVQTGKGVQCSVQYITIWDTEYEDKPFEVGYRYCIVELSLGLSLSPGVRDGVRAAL